MRTSANHLRDQLEAMLSEGVRAAIDREQTEFDRETDGAKKIVLFGAAKLGRKTALGLRAAGVEPVAFSDNNSALWGTSVEGIPVLSPTDAARRFGSEAAFLVTIWGRGSHDTMANRQQAIKALGVRRVSSFVPLYWKFSDLLLPHNAMDLPHLVMEQAGDVMRCFEVLTDDVSRQQFLNQISWRITGDFDVLSDPTPDEIYFPSEIELQHSETFVDCGAFDGDTILRFLDRTRGHFEHIFAFEPDPANWAALKNTVAGLPDEVHTKISMLPYAVGETSCTVRFSASGTLGASVGEGDLEVKCVRLDEILASEAPTYIKMDIEASEPDALRGASKIIRHKAPVIAACSYHVQEHAWSIPLVMHEMNPEYAIMMRQHIQLVEDLVSYAVPRDRYKAVLS